MEKTPSQSDFQTWRSPRRGISNPEKWNNPFWQWCVQTREPAYSVNQKFNGPSPLSSGPCWCFQRFGQPQLTLPDGREIYIGGEHEDHYDPDFFIYNDVVIIDGDQIDIFCYPESDFPPTDFHTATLVGNQVILIGNLGYPANRRIGETQVLRLDLTTFKMSRQATTGENPGWIYNHCAIMDEPNNVVRVTGGNRCEERIIENFHTYELCLETFTWRLAVKRNWRSWILEREDGEANQLWEIRQESWNRKLGLSTADMLTDSLQELPADIIAEMTPTLSDHQLQQIQNLYNSPFDDSVAIEDGEKFGRHRLSVNGVPVRFDEDMFGVTVTIEGELPDKSANSLLSQLQEKLESIEKAKYRICPIAP